MYIYRPFNNEIVVVEDFLTQEEADYILDLATKDISLWDASNDGSGLTEQYGNRLQIDEYNLRDRYPDYNWFFKMLEERAKPIFSKEYGISDFSFLPITSIFRRTGHGLDVHTDEVDKDHPQYDASLPIITHGFVVYINNNYSGGEIFYPNKNITMKPKALSLVMHPGNKEYEHGVNDVTKEIRYNLAWWTR